MWITFWQVYPDFASLHPGYGVGVACKERSGLRVEWSIFNVFQMELKTMVRYRRVWVDGGTYFFTLTLIDRHASYLTQYVDELRQAFRESRKNHPFKIEAIVVLPEHLHMILTLPEGVSDYARRIQSIKAIFSRKVANLIPGCCPNNRGEYNLWQRRYWEHLIRDEEDFNSHVDYIHYNPVKHKLVDEVKAWPYSSFHHYVRERILPQDWAGYAFTSNSNFGER
ncbi:REP-associated tyrosine transposase [Lacimicrobium alkaliphilum]|nr:transposase [Lacimicrobium alkaliphilum]